MIMECLCDKCNKEAPTNKEMSTEKWIVYNTKENCECGGRFITKLTP